MKAQSVARRGAFIDALKEEICNILLCLSLVLNTRGCLVAAASPQRSAVSQAVWVAARRLFRLI